MIDGLLLAAALVVNDGNRPGTRWRYDCATIRRMVEAHGEETVVTIARARGVPEQTIEEARSRCLRK